MNDKDHILEETRGIISSDEEMGIAFLKNIFVGIFLVLIVVFPKIFINTQIYYKSREISALSREHDTLMEENRLISAKVEALRYKNQILDTLF